MKIEVLKGYEELIEETKRDLHNERERSAKLEARADKLEVGFRVCLGEFSTILAYRPSINKIVFLRCALSLIGIEVPETRDDVLFALRQCSRCDLCGDPISAIVHDRGTKRFVCKPHTPHVFPDTYMRYFERRI